ncbi:hypothetical protein [Actinospica robiniae]|uniref:hypothetical protein n=1 Tax=Actinospica robiniae TaxID=304901 RepID=UPI00146FB811|nr:hypothetical protein [Actinospica robiniae]
MWITSIATLITALTGTGLFFIGRATAPRVATTPTTQVTVTPADAPSTASSSATKANGTLLGTYTFQIPPYATVPLGTTQPTQAQFVQGSGLGDLYLDTSGLVGPGTDFKPANGNKMVVLPSGTPATYQSCSTDTGFVQNVDNTVGAVFCLIETTGRIPGVTVMSIESSQPYASVLHVSLWQDAQ